jgi:hypothetical protein
LYTFQAIPSPSERVAKVEKIITPANHFMAFFKEIKLTQWFTAGNNIVSSRIVRVSGGLAGFSSRF